MDEALRKVGLAYAKAAQARGEREAAHVTVDLGQGIGWRVPRLRYERIVHSRSRR